MMLRKPIRRVASTWYLWLFPLFALLISAAFLWQYYAETGVRIKIHFEDAAGIQTEKTRIRYRGVPVGTVKGVSLADDQKTVVVEAVLAREFEEMAVVGSRFTLVLPKVDFQGVSGLETIFEGTYINVLPGPKGGQERTVFNAQTTGNTDPLDDTSAYLLVARSVENVGVGDSVTFRGLKIGSVTKVYLAKDGQAVQVQINLENRYARVVRENTLFWRKAAIDARFGLFGSRVRVNSMDTVMSGGIELATPDPAGPMAKNLAKFVLHDAPPKEFEKWNPKLTSSGRAKKAQYAKR